jgi:hypothetical protein
MAKIQYIRTLESIAVGIRDLAIARAPKDTGNLRRRIKEANTPAKTKMIKQLKDFSVIISLDYAPSGAEYGQWFNEPPAVNSKRRKKLQKTAIRKGNWNYAIEALNDDDLSKRFEEYLQLLGDYVVEDIELEFDKI